MLRILFGYDSKVADLELVICSQVLKGVLVILGHFVRSESGRHGGQSSIRKVDGCGKMSSAQGGFRVVRSG